MHWTNVTKLDHCNSVLAGTAGYLQNWLESALNAAARLIYSRRASEHTQPHCSGTFTGYAYRSESSFGCVFWHITVCMAQHRRILQTACGRHQTSPSSLCRNDYAAGAADSPRHCLSGGSGAGVEQSASTDQGRLVTVVISAANESSSLPSVIQLTERSRCSLTDSQYEPRRTLCFYVV